MADAPATFSESWYRIANQRICLRPGVKVQRQNYRGERWFVLQNPFSNQFFRLRPAAYEFVARLRPDRTVQEVWQECLHRFPDDAPGQEAVIQLLAQLYLANLLQYELAADAAQLFKRFEKRRQRELRARLLNVMFMRIPLLDPDSFLIRTMPLVGPLISWFGALLWVVVVGAALKVVADNFPTLVTQSQNVLAPGNLLPLYLCLVVVKTLHEFGHAYFCRKFGGEVHTMGVLFMIFTPTPYVDATSSWAFRNRWQRVLIGAAGMVVELFVAALATFIWARTGPGTVHGVAYNIMFIASVSTIIFNLNPLLRFDGYYILSDLLGLPNLNQRAGQQLRYLVERYGFGLKKAENPTPSRHEAGWLVSYGVLSGIYRVVVFGGVLLFVADRLLIVGIIMAAVCAVAWVMVPLGRFSQYLAASPALERQRLRAVSVTIALVAAVLLLFQVIPFPSHFRAAGVLHAREWSEVVNETAGRVEAVLAPPGSRVMPGQPLVGLRNPELELELKDARARRDEVEARVLYAMNQETADVKPLSRRLEAIDTRIAWLQTERQALTLRARHEGVWISPEVQEFVGRWMVRGSRLGLVVNPAAFEFRAAVSQEDVDSLFARHIHGAEVRLFGQVDTIMPVQNLKMIPAEQRALPSPALGWLGGGDVPTAPDDAEGRTAAEPFFEVKADALPREGLALLHGRTGRIRFELDKEPLLPRGIRRLWQLFQRRYQL
jgi:putative peptide zinc metalloprotease protein